MNPIKLKDLIKEIFQESEAPHFPQEKEYYDKNADYIDSVIKKLSPTQKNDNAEIFQVLQSYFKNFDSHGMERAIISAKKAFQWNDIDTGLVDEYLDNMAGAANNPNDSDQY